MTEIGRLIEIDPRSVWRHEARNFTPWLAAHLDQLGEVIGMRLELEDTEVAVETFSADIQARNVMDDSIVLIENQIEVSDHLHLGQIMTYLAGMHAQTIVWIAREFREAHLSAIKWLNEHTVEPFAFFAVRLRVVRIGDSLPAPIFEIVERPNVWERQLQIETHKRHTRSPRAEERTEFWARYLERHPEDGKRGVVANGKASQWLVPDQEIGLVVSLYVALGGVGLFLRGHRGSTPAEVHARFSPVAQQFAALVGNELGPGGEDGYPGYNMPFSMKDRAQWDHAIDWLHEKGHLWLAAAVELFGDGQQ